MSDIKQMLMCIDDGDISFEFQYKYYQHNRAFHLSHDEAELLIKAVTEHIESSEPKNYYVVKPDDIEVMV